MNDTRPSARSPAILLSAFGIHIGGGLVLLQALLRAGSGAWKSVALDARLEAPEADGLAGERVPPSILARIAALRRLARRAEAGDVLFCFNSLPPLARPARGVRVVCYVHAPHFVGAHRGVRYAPVTRLRIAIERIWFAMGMRNCDEFWVQTPTMAQALLHEHPGARVQVVPFVDDGLFAALHDEPARADPPAAAPDQATFFYPAEFVGHKNHSTLVQAWDLLGKRGCQARLQLTLRPPELAALHIERPELASLEKVTNLGRLTRAQVLDAMRASSAMLFASRAETFGLPLLEAAAHGVPVLAAEKDFVRDVCEPAQTFDPASPHSIADAVLRFLGRCADRRVKVLSARQVIERLLA